ncbi:MAG: AmmeMemoRadiSam system protein B [Lentisphaerales bacterium]|nr:AmmeMemoRadiSam system protein B [Lentisphaerales bacterium]
MGNIRRAAVAGTFYYNSPTRLLTYVNELLDHATDQPDVGKAIIAPHAGHIYSGPIAASAYRSLRKRQKQIKKVVLIGPSHYVGFMGLATSTADHYETPLGLIPLDTELANQALEIKEVVTMDHAHLQEHSLEVHLPFLQATLNDFTLLPIVIGETSNETIAAVLSKVWGGDETLIICSTDLSHYMDYNGAQTKDQKTVQSILNGNLENLTHNNACGLTPIKGLIKTIKQKKLTTKLLDLRNSGDTAGDKERVVGYASFLIDTEPNMNLVFSREDQIAMLKLGRTSLEEKLLGNHPYQSGTIDVPNVMAATFITLTKNGQLRGCIGSLEAHRKLREDIIENTYAAAFRDPRFPTLKANELKDISISISILSQPQVIQFESEQDLLTKLKPGFDGLILTEGNKRGTFLPSVWEELPSAQLFLKHLKEKAGLTADYWSDTIQIERYGSVYINENLLN